MNKTNRIALFRRAQWHGGFVAGLQCRSDCARQRMRLQPKDASRGGRINASLVPPRAFIATAMQLAVMSPTQRYRKLIADLTAKRQRLGKAQVVSIGGAAST